MVKAQRQVGTENVVAYMKVLDMGSRFASTANKLENVRQAASPVR